jgi:hypothetical protein
MTLSVKGTSIDGLISTDRFGYTGSVQRYDTLSDAIAAQNVKSTTTIGNRDLSITVVQGMPSYGSDFNVLMGSWWYTTEGDMGWGNTRGNSGVGFLQIYDDNASTITNASFGFSGFDGTYWTDFNFSLTGTNADYNDYARMWVDYQGSGADNVLFLNYNISLTASGLQGVQTGGVIEADNHPTGVTGTFTALFENVSTTFPGNNGYYAMTLDLNMDNWAYEQGSALNPKWPFAPSTFAVHTPDGGATVGMIGLVLGLLALYHKKRS